MSTPRTRTLPFKAATEEELLDHEESRAIQRITGSVQRLGDDFLVATDLRERIRRHPFMATGIGALAGFVGGPLLFGAFRRTLAMTSTETNPASRPLQTLPRLLLTTLRGVRARGGRDR